ncbi:MAG TPA: molybdopterin dinucleotide binding domain-containing protein, partial [Acidimicrobiia bacterium]|nr:molybdopterin dinucleotide binding domain-containing protein [Acidimicrobiia bacterium]
LGSDPLNDFPDRALAAHALDAVERVIVVGAVPADGGNKTSVVLPVTVWGEQEGTTSNLEGRVQRVARKVTPGGTAMEGWRIAGELATRFDADFDLETTAEVQDEIARVAPAFAGVDAQLLRSARDGVVLPLADHADEIEFGPAPLGAGVSWEPIPSGSDAEATTSADVEVAATDAEVDTEAEAAAAAEPPTPTLPLHVWHGSAPAAAVVPVDGYALRLVAARTLYGTDRAVFESPALATFAPTDPVLLVHRVDRDRIGVVDGDRVRITSARGTVELPIVADASTQQGTAFLAVNRQGPGASELVDPNEPVTDLRVETVR